MIRSCEPVRGGIGLVIFRRHSENTCGFGDDSMALRAFKSVAASPPQQSQSPAAPHLIVAGKQIYNGRASSYNTQQELTLHTVMRRTNRALFFPGSQLEDAWPPSDHNIQKASMLNFSETKVLQFW